MMKKTTQMRENLDKNISDSLLNENKIICCIDNNQKGNSLKYQRFGHCNKYIKVTGSVIIKYKYCHDIINLIDGKVTLTYTDQNIPSPILMPHFEKLWNNTNGDIKSFDLLHVIRDITQVKDGNRYHDIYPTLHTDNVDFTGERVKTYFYIAKTVKVLELIQKVASGCYAAITNRFEFVNHSRDEWKTNRMKSILMYIHDIKVPLLNMKTDLFQFNIVSSWNEHVNDVMKVIIPRVFLYDEITTDGYGKCVIELMTKHNIFDKVQTKKNTYQWVLSEDWNKKTMVVCLDGLSLDRHRLFSSKLSNIPLSFTQSFKQSLVFQKALSGVIEISGPLHMDFHMLQSVFSIYKLFIRAVQECLG